MKFNWGTGILIFLIMFLLACAGFIYFAFQQEVNLVHKDYYEKGVGHTDQMKVNARSVSFKNAFEISNQEASLVVNIAESLAARMDSGRVLMFRPSSSKQDIWYPLEVKNNALNLPKENLIAGRYILKIYWYSEGLKYEVDNTVNIQ